jgi:hypothetical protein
MIKTKSDRLEILDRPSLSFQWIPAFAGMTHRVGRRSLTSELNNMILALLLMSAAALSSCSSYSNERAFIAPPPVKLSQQDSYFSQGEVIAANIQPAAGGGVDVIEQAAEANQNSGCAALRTNFSKNEPLSVDMGDSRLGVAMASDRNDFDVENTNVAARATVRYSVALGGDSVRSRPQSCANSFWAEFREQ